MFIAKTDTLAKLVMSYLIGELDKAARIMATITTSLTDTIMWNT